MFLLIFVTFLLQSLYSSSFSSQESYYKNKGDRIQGYKSPRVLCIDNQQQMLSILHSDNSDSSCLGSKSAFHLKINQFSKIKKSKKPIQAYVPVNYDYLCEPEEHSFKERQEINPVLASARYNSQDGLITFFLKKKKKLEEFLNLKLNEEGQLGVFQRESQEKVFEVDPMSSELRAELVAGFISIQAAEGLGTILRIESTPDKEFIFKKVLPFLNLGTPVIIKNASRLKLGFDFSDCTSLARIVLNKDEFINEAVFYSVINLLFQERTKKNHEDQHLIEEEDQEVIEEEDQEVIESKNLVKEFLPTLQKNAGVAEKKGYTIEPAIAHLFKIVAKGSYRDKHGLDGIKLALTDLDAALTDFSKDVSSTMKTTVNSSTNEFKNTLKIKSKSSGWFSSATSFIVPLLKYGMISYGMVSLFQKMMPILKKIRG